MMGPEGVTTALVKHALAGIPTALQRIREQWSLQEAQLPMVQKVTGYQPLIPTLGDFPMVCLNVEDTTGRLDTRRQIDGGEGDLYIRVYRVTARVWIASKSEVETKQAVHRYALALREGMQMLRKVQGVPATDSLEILTRNTTERFEGTMEQSGRFIASSSFVFHARAEEFVAAVQSLGPVTVGSVNINTGAAVAGRDDAGDLTEGGIVSAQPFIQKMTLGNSPTNQPEG